MILLDRRRALALAGATALGWAGAAQAGWSLPVDVRTRHGPVRGNAAGGVQVFKGVRYGAPPIGPLRFRPPQPPEPWTALADANKFPPPAIQMPAPSNLAPPASPLAAALAEVFPIRQEAAADSEDCLFLNVWTPKADAKARPVMVWLHGGGFAYGSGAWPMYDGAALAKRGDLVVVTVNHRLNAFGYMDVSALGPEYAESGNAGMLDLVLALQWVRDNARAFGGDPGNVTVFGESGGGAKVSCLLAMPAAKGLFHRAIIQSGPGLEGVPKAAAAQQAAAILAELKIASGDAQALQRASADDILKAAYAVQARQPMGFGGPRFLGPVTDGRVLPRDPFVPDASPVGRDIPVMVGANKDEMTLFVASEPWFGRLTEAELTARAAAFPNGPATLAALKASRPDYSPSYLMAALISWAGLLGGSVTLADRKAAQGGAPVFSYRLDWETPVGEGVLKSPHALEIPLVFRTVESNRMFMGPGEAPLALSDLMSDAWIAFARTGDPNTAALPDWPRYDTRRRATMVFDAGKTRIVDDPEGAVRAALQGGTV